jgi:hypothetical protein
MRTRDVLISPKGSGDLGLIRKLNGVLLGGREQALQESDSGVEHNAALATILDTGVNLVKVDEVGTNVVNIVDRGRFEIFLAKQRAKLERLGLHVTVKQILDARSKCRPTSPRGVESVWELLYVLGSW